MQDKVIRVLQIKQKTKDYILSKKSELFLGQTRPQVHCFDIKRQVPVGTCHDVRDLSYDNHLYSRARLNQSIESLSRNREETTRSVLIHQKFSKKSHL